MTYSCMPCLPKLVGVLGTRPCVWVEGDTKMCDMGSCWQAYNSVRTAVLDQGWCCLPVLGTFGNIWWYFWLWWLCVRRCAWHLGGRDQRCCKHPRRQRTPLPPPPPNGLHRTDSAVIEKPCMRGTGHAQSELFAREKVPGSIGEAGGTVWWGLTHGYRGPRTVL